MDQHLVGIELKKKEDYSDLIAKNETKWDFIIQK